VKLSKTQRKKSQPTITCHPVVFIVWELRHFKIFPGNLQDFRNLRQILSIQEPYFTVEFFTDLLIEYFELVSLVKGCFVTF
jgi:hypothetical protein